MATTLITGATGFVGGHLAELLLDRGDEVVGTSRTARWAPDAAHLGNLVRLVACDVTDPDAVRRVVREVRPARIYHLAAVANVPASFDDPERTWQVNLDGTRHLYEAVRAEAPDARVLFVGSGMVYGRVSADRLPIAESVPMAPTSPYAASKAAADLMSFQYADNYGLGVVRVRPFNQAGPRQSCDYALAHFACEIARLESAGGTGELCVGNLDARRDVTDVRDTVRAYAAVLDAAAPGEVYNVASGRAVAMRDVVDRLIRLADVPRVTIRPDPARMRPSDVAVVVGDASALGRRTGWRPSIELDQTLRDTLGYWRHRLGGG